MSRNLLRARNLEWLIDHYRVQDAKIQAGLSREKRLTVLRRAKIVGQKVYYYEGADRLMPLAKEAILQADINGTDLPSGYVWWANSLSQARGRMGRTWWAPEGGVYLCLALYPSIFNKNWPFYNLGAGVAIAQVLTEMGVPAKIRWVNDILIEGRKLAGILSETVRTPGSGETYLLFGIGINLNIDSFPEGLSQATSLSLFTGRYWSREQLAARVLARIGWIFGLLQEWESDCLDMGSVCLPKNPVLEAWNSLSDTPGRRVVYGLDADLDPEFEALALGIASDGGLKMLLDTDEEIKVNSGEIRYVDA